MYAIVFRLLYQHVNINADYSQTSNINRTLVGYKIVDHSDVVRASPVGATPATSSFSTYSWLQWISIDNCMQDETRNIYVLGFGARYTKGLTVSRNDNVIYSNVCYCVHLGLKLQWRHQWARWHLKSPASRVFAQPFIQAQIKENIEAPRHWTLWGQFTDDRWIPRTRSQ